MREAVLEGLEPVIHSPHKMLNSINRKLHAYQVMITNDLSEIKEQKMTEVNKPPTEVTFSRE